MMKMHTLHRFQKKNVAESCTYMQDRSLQNILSIALAVLLVVLVSLICANIALAWLVDTEDVLSDISLGEIKKSSYAAIYTDDGTGLRLEVCRGRYVADADRVPIAVFEDVESNEYDQESLPWKEYSKDLDSIYIGDDISPVSTAFWFQDCSRLCEVTFPSSFFFSESVDPCILEAPDPDNIADCDGLWYIPGTSQGLLPDQVTAFINDRCGSEGPSVTLTAISSPYAALYGNTVLVFGRGTVQERWSEEALELNEVYRGFESSADPLWLTKCRSGLKSVECSCENKIFPTTLRNWFSNCTALKTCDFSGFDMSGVISMDSVFSGCVSLEEPGISSWDVSGCETFSDMFRNCTSLEYADMSDWYSCMDFDASQGVLSYMFAGCSKISELDFSWTKEWRPTSNPLSYAAMDYALSGCTNLEKITVPTIFNFNYSNVNSIAPTPISNRNGYVNSNYWYIDENKSPKTSAEAFAYLSGLESENAGSGFEKTELVVLRSFRFFDDEDIYAAVYGGNLLVFDRGSDVAKTLDEKPLSSVYREVESTVGGTKASIPWFSTWGSSVELIESRCDLQPDDCGYWFYGFSGLRNVCIYKDFILPGSVFSMFEGSSSLEDLDLSSFDESGVKDMTAIFKNCSSLKKLNIDLWHPEAACNLSYMFSGCEELDDIDLSGFDTSSVTSMKYMFQGCSALKHVDVSSFDLCSMSDPDCMAYMFSDCSALGEIDLAGWSFDGFYSDYNILGKYSTFSYMFYNCSSLKALDLSSFRSPNWIDTNYLVTDRNSSTYGSNGTFEMLEGCSSLREITVPSSFKFSRNWNSRNLSLSSAYRFTSLPLNSSVIDCQIVIDGWYIDRGGDRYYVDSRTLDKSTPGQYVWNRYNSGDAPVTFYFGRDIISDEAYAATYSQSGKGRQLLVFGRCSLGKVPEMYEGLKLENYSLGIESDSCEPLWSQFNDSNLYTEVIVADTVNPTTMRSWFEDFSKCTSFDFALLNTSKVTNLVRCFRNCKALEYLDLSGWDTSHVAYFGNPYMAPYDKVPDRPNDGSLLANSCFNGLSSLKTIDLSGWDFSGRANLNSIYYGLSDSAIGFINNCPQLEEIDLSDCVFPSANLFWYNCASLKKMKLSSALTIGSKGIVSPSDSAPFDDSICDGRWYQSYGERGMTGDELSQFIRENALGSDGVSLTWFVGHRRSYAAIYMSDDDADGVLVFGRGYHGDTRNGYRLIKYWDDIEANNYSYTYDKSPWYLSYAANITKAESALYDYQLKIRPASNTMCNYFAYMSELRSADAGCFDTSSVSDMSYMFRACINLSEIKGMENWNTGNVVDMSGLFHTCHALSGFDAVSKWGVGRVESLRSMFLGCWTMNALDISGWRLGCVEDVSQMFLECSSLQSIVLPPTTPGITPLVSRYTTDMSAMFDRCGLIENIDVSNWDTRDVTDMSRAFNGCENLRSLDASGWVTSKVYNVGAMFKSCANLILDCSSWDVSSVSIKTDREFGYFSDGAPGVVEPLWELPDVQALFEDADEAGLVQSEESVEQSVVDKDTDDGLEADDSVESEEESDGFIFDPAAKPIEENIGNISTVRYSDKSPRQLRFRINLFTKETLPFVFSVHI